MSEDVTGLGLAFGTAEEGRAWVGRAIPPRRSEVPVTESMVKIYAALVEDANPRYWTGGECPPGLTMTLGFPLRWSPGTEGARTTLAAMDVPLPGHHIINVETDTEFLRPVTVGHTVTMTDEILSVSEEKATRLGRGHFLTTRTTYADDTGDPYAVNTNVLFRYDTAETA